MMISTWRSARNKAAGVRRASKAKQFLLSIEKNPNMEITIPTHFRCPISLELMKDPVTLSTGITYDRQSIETWIEAGNFTCPVTNQVLRSLELIPNHSIRRMIQDWCVQNSSYGIERIPTPRIPIAPIQVVEILSKIEETTKSGDQIGCLELVKKMKNLGKESERNRRCIVSNGTGRIISYAFQMFANSSFEKNGGVLEEILSALTWMCPFDEETESYLGSLESLRCMVWLLKSAGSISGRRNAICVLKELLSLNQRYVGMFVEIEGALEALFNLIKEPICPTTTKASLMVIYYLVSSSSSSSSSTSNEEKRVKSRLAQMGLVSILIEILVDCERSICEKALGVLDRIFDEKEGLEMAYNHVLTMPVLVKKLLRISDLATEFAVSVLWKLCKNEKKEDGGVLVEGLKVGAFQKLLLLLQVGCSERTKEKVTELLKMMNVHRRRAECIESMDFKQLQRPF